MSDRLASSARLSVVPALSASFERAYESLSGSPGPVERAFLADCNQLSGDVVGRGSLVLLGLSLAA